MPPRLPFSPASRQWLPRLFSSSPSASLHTTSPAAAIKSPSASPWGGNSSASTLLENDDASPRNPYVRRTTVGLRPGGRNPQTSKNPNQALQSLINQGLGYKMSDKNALKRQALAEKLADRTATAQYAGQMPRRWRPGDTYAPHDLSPEEAKKFRKSRSADVDLVDALGLNPVDEYRNFAIISEYMTPTGRIMHSKETGLRPVNQRKMAKAVRRAIGLGLHPSVHRHPEILNAAYRNVPQTIAGTAKKTLY